MFIIGKYVKIGLKTRVHHTIFSVLKIKNITKIKKKRYCFCLHSWFDWLHAKTDLDNKYMI